MKFDMCIFSDGSIVAPKKKYPTKRDFLDSILKKYEGQLKLINRDEWIVYDEYVAYRLSGDEDGNPWYTIAAEGSPGAFPVWILEDFYIEWLVKYGI